MFFDKNEVPKEGIHSFSKNIIFFYALKYCMFLRKKNIFYALKYCMFSDASAHFQTSRFPLKNEFSIKNCSGTLKLTKKAKKNSKKKLELIQKKNFFASKRPRTQVQYPVFENGLFPQCTPTKKPQFRLQNAIFERPSK